MTEDCSSIVGSDEGDPDSEIVVELPESLRPDLKEPLGPIFNDISPLIEVLGSPVIAVGDIVTYHLVEAGEPPDVAFVDERTERSAVEEGIRETVVGDGDDWFDRLLEVPNPSATVTASLLEALVTALDGEYPKTLVNVYGEEDLATLPAILAAPDGASVVYGQPGEGMVHVAVDDVCRDDITGLLDRMAGDPARVRSLLDR